MTTTHIKERTGSQFLSVFVDLLKLETLTIKASWNGNLVNVLTVEENLVLANTLPDLNKFRKLRQLHLENLNINFSIIPFPALTRLTLMGVNISKPVLAFLLSSSPRLTYLSIEPGLDPSQGQDQAGPVTLHHLIEFRTTEHVAFLENPDHSAFLIAHNLKILNLDRSQVSHSLFPIIYQAFPYLQSISLYGATLKTHDPTILSAMSGLVTELQFLTTLDFSLTNISRFGIAAICRCTRFIEIGLNYCPNIEDHLKDQIDCVMAYRQAGQICRPEEELMVRFLNGIGTF